MPLAATPLLFAAQQACEGAVWLVLERSPFGRSDTGLLRAFLFFALLVWPAYLPPALLVLEKVKRRRAALALAWALGIFVGGYLVACASLRASEACIAFGNLYYWVQIDAPLKTVAPYAYLACIVTPLLVSSVPGTSLLAIAAAVSFAVTGYLYRAGFISVWCFFAAVLAGLVVWLMRCRANPREARPDLIW